MTDWQVTDTNCTLLIYKSTFCLVFRFTFFLKIGVEKVIEVIFGFISFVFFPFLKSKMKWMNWRKKKIKNSPFRKRQRRKRVRQLWDHAASHQGEVVTEATERCWASVTRATNEIPHRVEGEWLMSKNWPPASKATASTITHSSSVFDHK